MFDPLGSISESLTSSGTIESHSIYDAYGNKLNSGTQSPFGFGAQAGYITDTESGLMFLTHRYYDPTEGRFLTRDPIGYSGGLNLYAYCGNNPVEHLDPSGLFDESELDAWEQLSGAKGFLNAFSAGWSRSANDSRNALLAQAGADDYACKSPLGIEAIKYGSITTAGIVASITPMPFAGYLDDAIRFGSRYIKGIPSYFRYIKGNLKINPYRKEMHHLLPRQYRDYFELAGLDIEKYKMVLFRYEHVLKKGIHPSGWNKEWRKFKELNKTPDPEEIKQFLEIIKRKYGL